MRICVVGAGAIGGYFGARLAEAGRDVTFLVRPARAEALAAGSLRAKSPLGDVTIAHPATVLADEVTAPFDLVILACKAYDLGGAMDSMLPAIGPETSILPLLNGMAHLDALEARFGAGRVLGGQCVIGATLGPDGTVIHLNDMHGLTYGERDGTMSPRIRAIEALMTGVKFTPQASDQVVLAMWEKWVFLASLAAGTSLMRATIGDIVSAPGGRDFMSGLFDECSAIATASGYAPREAFVERSRGMLTNHSSPLTASMARDIQNGSRIEADHVVGDLIGRGRAAGIDASRRLETAFTHLKAYEARREREIGSPAA